VDGAAGAQRCAAGARARGSELRVCTAPPPLVTHGPSLAVSQMPTVARSTAGALPQSGRARPSGPICAQTPGRRSAGGNPDRPVNRAARYRSALNRALVPERLVQLVRREGRDVYN